MLPSTKKNTSKKFMFVAVGAALLGLLIWAKRTGKLAFIKG